MRVHSLCSKTLAVVFLSLMIHSCKKGDTGPAGATGTTGATGTANVIYSDWFTPATYTKDTVFGTYGFYNDKAASGITQPILDSGTVITFGKLVGYSPVIWPTTQVSQLPIVITYMDGANPNIDTWSALVTLNNLRIQLQSSLNAYGGISNAHKFRYIIIPGGVKATTSANRSAIVSNGKQLDAATVHAVVQNYKQLSYAELCAALNIPE